MKTFEEFVKQVAEVRQLQKEYFKTRSPETLKQSKLAERELDNLLLDLEAKQTQLFDKQI